MLVFIVYFTHFYFICLYDTLHIFHLFICRSTHFVCSSLQMKRFQLTLYFSDVFSRFVHALFCKVRQFFDFYFFSLLLLNGNQFFVQHLRLEASRFYSIHAGSFRHAFSISIFLERTDTISLAFNCFRRIERFIVSGRQTKINKDVCNEKSTGVIDQLCRV